MAAVVAVARAGGRRRRRSLVVLALLVALVGRVVLTSAAGARRTSTAFDRFAAVTLARHVRVQVESARQPEQVFRAVERLPEVGASGRIEIFPFVPNPEHVEAPDDDVTILASPDGGLFRDVEQPVVIEGRLPDPSAPHEATLNEFARDQLGLGVGDEFPVLTFEPGALAVLWEGGAFPGFNGPSVTFHITGITRIADDLIGSAADSNPAVLATPALHQRYGTDMDGLGVMLAARRGGGEHDVPAVRAAAREAAGPGGVVFVEPASAEVGDRMRGAMSVLANSLWIFAVGLPAMAAVLTGAVAAVAGAVVLSPSTPIGLARRAEPFPGFDVDLVVLTLGPAVLLAAAAAWTWTTAGRRVRRSPQGPNARPSTVTTAAAAAGLGPAAVLGLRHALERGGGQQAVPVRSTMLAVVLGVVGVVVTLVLRTRLRDLVEDPARYGWAWSSEPDVEGFEEALASLVADERVKGVALSENRSVEIGGLELMRPVDNPEPGEGALFTPEGLAAVARSDGFRLLVRYPEGADPAEYEALLSASHPIEFSVYSYPRLPASLDNLEETGGVIGGLGVFFALLGVAGGEHGLVVATRRRRHDLAVLRSMGIRRRQVRTIVTTHALTLGAVGAVTGIVMGLAVGRTVWRVMVGHLGLVDRPTVPAAAVVVLSLIVLAGAAALAQIPARAAMHRSLTQLLREER